MTRSRGRSVLVAVAPVVLLLAFVAHPHLPGRQPNVDAIAAATTEDPTRWAIAHLAATFGAILLILAFLAVDGWLRERRPNRWTSPGLMLIVAGTALYAVLPGMEFAPLAAAESGGDVVAAQEAVLPWFIPVLAAAAVTTLVGMLRFAAAFRGLDVLPRRHTNLVAAALVVMAVSRFVPLAAVQFYVQGIAAVLAMWPLAAAMRNTRHADAPTLEPAVG